MTFLDKYGNNKLYFSTYKIFDTNSGVYLYKTDESSIFQIDENLLKILNCEGETLKECYQKCKKYFTKEAFEQLISELYKEQFIYFERMKSEPVLLDESKLSALTLMIAQECNMRCTYCYGEAGEYNNKGMMSIDVAIDAIDYLIKNSTEKNLAVAFMGGEPLLNYSLIKSVVEYCKTQEKKNNKVFSYTMTTNGTLINSEIEQFLIDNHIVTQISIDGDKEKHDKNRIFANDLGSYDKVITQTKSMRSKGVLTARATLSIDNLNYIDVFKHLDSLNFRAIPIAVAQNMVPDSQFANVIEAYKKYILFFKSLIQDKEYSKAKKVTDLMNALEKLEYANERKNGCGAGRYMVAVDIQGECYPCHRYVGNKKYCLGSIYKEINRKTFLESTAFRNKKQCEECWAKNLCLGGCPYENGSYSGSIDGISKLNCAMTKMMFEELINIYISLSEDDKKNLFTY